MNDADYGLGIGFISRPMGRDDLVALKASVVEKVVAGDADGDVEVEDLIYFGDE